MNLRELAETLAVQAGEQLRAAFHGAQLETATKSSPTDLVSEADLAAEALIRAGLRAARPDDGILGEEGTDQPGTTGLRWIVDPLDGTVNFLFGIPQWAVSVAVEDAEGTLAGAVCDPMRGELWSADRGGPPLLNGTPVRPSGRTELATALVATGFGYESGIRAEQARIAARLLPAVRDIRRFGSAALDLTWTAAGRYDAYFERGVKTWDVAAGALLCRCAGLDVRRLATGPCGQDGVLVAAPVLADALEPLLA